MTLRFFCIAGGESGPGATHLYLQLSTVFIEPCILTHTKKGITLQ